MWLLNFFINFILLLAFLNTSEGASDKDVVYLTEDTWREMLQGQWLVKFYAPWCPACRAMEDTWKKVATWQPDLGIKVGEVDVSEYASLSGRFLITALPTIYHVKDGVFRQYKGARDENSIISFVDDNQWKELDPVPWYFNPDSLPMASIGCFFKISLAIRDMHNQMTSEYGVPVWGSYLIFAILTIIVGLMLGLLIVCCCDYCCLPQPKPREPTRYTAAHPDGHYRIGEPADDVLENDNNAELIPPADQDPSSNTVQNVRQRPPRTD